MMRRLLLPFAVAFALTGASCKCNWFVTCYCNDGTKPESDQSKDCPAADFCIGACTGHGGWNGVVPDLSTPPDGGGDSAVAADMTPSVDM
jgi:hypothetical protein